MAEVKCVEPAMVGSEPGSDYVCMVKPEDTLLFPPVDVCLAAAWINSTGSAMIGGHVPGRWDEHSADDLNGCARRVFTLMDQKWGERSSDLIITLGDPSDPEAPAWTDIVRTMVRNKKAERYLMIWKNIPGGADLRVDRAGGKLAVASTRTRQVVLERTLDSIKKDELPLTYRLPVLFKVVENLKTHFKAEPFKGSGSFHDSCPAKEQERITNLFKDIHRVHGACAEFRAPLDSSLSGDATFLFRDGEKVIMNVALAQHAKYTDRFLIKNITSAFRQFGKPA